MAGIVICLLVAGALVVFFFIKRKSWRLSRRQDPEQNEPLSPLASGLKRKSHSSYVFILLLLCLYEEIAKVQNERKELQALLFYGQLLSFFLLSYSSMGRMVNSFAVFLSQNCTFRDETY